MTTLKTLKNGDYFKRKLDSKKVYVKSDYDKSLKKFSCYDFNDVNSELFLKSNTIVFIDFEF